MCGGPCPSVRSQAAEQGALRVVMYWRASAIEKNWNKGEYVDGGGACVVRASLAASAIHLVLKPCPCVALTLIEKFAYNFLRFSVHVMPACVNVLSFYIRTSFAVCSVCAIKCHRGALQKHLAYSRANVLQVNPRQALPLHLSQ